MACGPFGFHEQHVAVLPVVPCAILAPRAQLDGSSQMDDKLITEVKLEKPLNLDYWEKDLRSTPRLAQCVLMMTTARKYYLDNNKCLF